MENKKQENLNFNNVSEIEILSKRGKREKHFLQKDGTIIARMYSDNIHFKENDKYIEIDNRLEKIQNYYKNKRNSFNVYFKENSCDNFLGYELNDGYLSFELLNNNNVPVKILDNGNQFSQTVKYENLFDGIDFEYVVTPTTLKENIVIKNKNDILDVINFRLNTNLKLELNNGSINAIKDNEVLFNLDVPYMIDSNKHLNHNVKYELREKQGFYELDLILDQNWLNSDSIVYPVTIDPTISTYNGGNVYDTYIYPGDTNVNRNNQDILKAGVEKNNGKDVINRSLIRFELPTIGTGSQIYEATLNLVSYSMYSIESPFNTRKNVDVHRITTDWTESGANWNLMSNMYDERVETSFSCSRSWEEYSWEGNVMNTHVIPAYGVANITTLVKKWYTGTPNYGIMLKAHKEVYDGEMFPAFYSKNNTLTGDNPKPRLEIIYRNQNGLESYMNYQSQSFNDGIVYENTYNGNVIAQFELGAITNSKMPVNLSLIYNTNDVVLNNNVGLGIGYKFNLWQTIKPENISGTDYLQYVDDDGTIHYFYEDEGVYKDEEGLNMTIEINGNEYILKDKYESIMIFKKINNIGYLSQMKDVEGNIINVNYNSDNLIEQITDENNQKISIVYEMNKISIVSESKSVILNYIDDRIDNMLGLEGYTYFTYNGNSLINKIIDVDGTNVIYEYYDQKPYKIKKVTEYGANNIEGASFTMEYGHKLTTIIDNKGRTTTISFNDYGNPICTSTLRDKDDVASAYGTVYQYGEYEQYKNKLLSNRIPVKYVNNYLKNTSFENDNIYFNSDSEIQYTISDEFSYSGFKSLKVVSNEDNKSIKQSITVPKGNFYTFSAYIKNSNAIKLSIGYVDYNNEIIEQDSDLIIADNEFNRYDVTINYPDSALGDLFVKIYLVESGTVYIDDVQLEEGEVANHFNYIENSNFSEGLGALEYISSDNNSNHFEVVTLSDGKSKALKIKMDPEVETHVEKQFNVCGKKGDQYNLSFWYKNNGIISNEAGVISGSAAWLQVFYNDSDDIYANHCVPITHLNPSEDEWQYFSVSYVTEADYNSFKIHFGQLSDANELYITNLSLFKSISSSEYDYDEKGNLKTAIGNNNEVNSFAYDSNNQLINSTNPKGKHLMYEYDNKVFDRLINSISELGICSEVKYDLNGNKVLNRINKKGVTGDIIDGLYKLRVKGTNLYLRNIMNSIKVKSDCNQHDLWNLEKVDNYYKINHSIVPNKFFTIKNNKLILSSFNENNSLFALTKNLNGSYLLSLKDSDKYIKFDDGDLAVSSLVYEDSSFEFYFETVDEEKFIETNYEYTDDGKFIKSVTDTNFNKIIYDIDTKTGLTKNTTNAKNQKSFYEYDEMQRLTSIIVNDDRRVDYVYNNQNALDKIIYGTKEYNFTYDNFMNNKSLKIGDDITLITNNYESGNGNLLSTNYGNGHYINYDYDTFDRIKTITKTDNVYDFKYGNNGDLLKVVSNDDVIKFSYDLGKRLTGYRTAKFSFNHTYDTSNNIVKKEFKLNNFNQKIDNIFNEDDALIETQFDNCKVNYNYDRLGRINSSNVNNIISTSYSYVTNGKRTSMLVNGFKSNDDKYFYKFDKLNNITHVYHNDILKNRYYYNKYNELIKEDDYLQNKTIKYSYDNCGNILFKKEYDFYNNLISENIYEYNNLNWEDQLTKFNDDVITYDEIGNPINIGNNICLNWINGKQLHSYNDSVNTVNYKYDYTNTRTSKIVNGIETKYYLEGTQIIFEKTENNMIYYMYDNLGGLIGFKYDNSMYYYVKNPQNDILSILDGNGNTIVKYQYDSWGNHVSIKDANGNEITDPLHIGLINPFRYRSYYFDKETNLYYLNNRYYNPSWGRFLNADDMLVQSSSLTGYNLFVYTDNNPTNKSDNSGNISIGFALLVIGALCLVCTASSRGSKNKKNKKGSKSNTKKSSKSSKKVNTSIKEPIRISSMDAGTLVLAGTAASSETLWPALVIVAGAVIVYMCIDKLSTIITSLVDNAIAKYEVKAKPCTKARLSHGDVERLERLTIAESQSYVEMGGNVMCDDHNSAYKVALYFPGHYIDEPHKDMSGYYWHYHPIKKRIKPHIWFYGEPPEMYRR